MKICKIENCKNKQRTRGLCQTHYTRWRRYGDANYIQNKGVTKLPEYYVWVTMIARCENPNAAAYKYYGKKGIKVCPEWQNDFWRFYKDMGPRPNCKMQIDRINNDGDYEPDNCRWTTAMINTRNSSVAKINSQIANQIRNLYKQKSNRQIAKQFHVSHTTVNQIISNKRWKSI